MPRFCGSCNRPVHNEEFHVDMGIMGRQCILIAVEDQKSLVLDPETGQQTIETVEAEQIVPRTKANNRRWVHPTRVPHLA